MPLTPQMMHSMAQAAIAATSPFRVRLVVDGREHTGARGSANSARKYRPHGFTDGYRLTWIGCAAEFPRGIEQRKRVVCDGTPLEVTASEVDPAGGLIRVDLQDPVAEGA